MIRPHITGSYQKKSWGSWNYDTPLFSLWTVSWEDDAPCGHDMCGVDWFTEEFVTWTDAMKFAGSLIKT